MDEVAEALAGTSGGATPDPRQWEAVRAMVRQGVPNHMRAKLWPVRRPGSPPWRPRSTPSNIASCLNDKTRNTKAFLGPTRACISLTRLVRV